jgi:hypothetical protein
MKINKTSKEELDYVKNRTGPKPDSKKPIQTKKPKTRSK